MNPWKILHIGKYYPPFAGGIENFHADLVREQVRQGMNVTSLVHHHQRGCPTAIELREDGSRVCRVRLWGRLLYTPLCPGFRRSFSQLLREIEPDIIHFHLPNPSAKLALTLRSARRIPWVVQWQSDVVASTVDRRLKWAYRCYAPLERRFLAQSVAIIAASPPYLETSQPLQPWRDKAHVVPLGIDRQRLPTPTPETRRWAEQQWQADAFRILDVGRLTYYKGHEYLIRAIAGTPGAQLCLVGSGDLRQQLETLIRELGVQQRVRLMGFVPDEQVRGLLAACHCLCLPSIERTEAFGVAMVEAMRYGKPVIACRIPGSGVGWVVEDERTGILVPPADTAALTKAVMRLQNDSALRQHLGAAAAHAFEQRFDIAPVAAAIERIYRQATETAGI